MGSILLIIFGSLLVYGYLDLAMRYIKLITSRQKVKVVKMDRNAAVITLIVVLIWLISNVIREYGNDNFVFWCVILTFETIYTIIISVNPKYVYICDDRIIFSDRSKKAEDHSYRVNNNLLEILPDKPQRKIEKFSIEDDMDLLNDQPQGAEEKRCDELCRYRQEV